MEGPQCEHHSRGCCVELKNSVTLGLLPVFRVTGETKVLLEGERDDPSCGEVEAAASTSRFVRG